MDSQKLAIEALESRLAELERRDRERSEVLSPSGQRPASRTRLRGFWAAGIGLIAVVLSGSRFVDPLSHEGVIEAKEFVLRDPSGQIRGRFALGDDGSPRLLLNDSEGRPRVQLSVGPNGTPGIRLLDESRHAEIGMAVSPGGRPGLVLSDRDGKSRVNLALLESGSPTLSFRDPSSKRRLTLESQEDGTPSLALRDSSEAIRLSLVVLPGGVPGVNLLDAGGFPRAVLHESLEGDPHLRMYGKNHQESFAAPPKSALDTNPNR